MSAVEEIDSADATEYAPALETITAMPLTFSIAHGLAFGFIAYGGKGAVGRWSNLSAAVVIAALLFVLKFALLSAGASGNSTVPCLARWSAADAGCRASSWVPDNRTALALYPADTPRPCGFRDGHPGCGHGPFQLRPVIPGKRGPGRT